MIPIHRAIPLAAFGSIFALYINLYLDSLYLYISICSCVLFQAGADGIHDSRLRSAAFVALYAARFFMDLCMKLQRFSASRKSHKHYFLHAWGQDTPFQ